MDGDNSVVIHKNGNRTRSTDLVETNNSSRAPAAINIENSSEIVLGPITQVNGPVTIYQKEDFAELDSGLYGGPSTTHKRKKWLFSKRLIYIGVALTVFVIAVVTTVTILVNNSTSYVFKRLDQQNEYIHEGGDILKPLGPGAIIEKIVWGGRASLNSTIPLLHPTPLVIISHTATSTCQTFVTCSKKMQTIQNGHFETGSLDIGYNFIIGGDGNAYVGRGWDITNFHQSDNIGISFIGHYVYDCLTPMMIEVAEKLLIEGVDKGKLAEDYKLVAHNQTYDTLSPGPNIFEVIQTWPHYDPSNYYP